MPRDFAFTPDDGPPRLIRYVERGTLLDDDVVSIYDESANLLIVDRQHFEQLSPVEQHELKRTHKPVTFAGEYRRGRSLQAAE